MEFTCINPDNDLSSIIKVLNISFATVASEFGFTKETNPTNNAFIDEQTLRSQLNKGITLYTLSINKKITGCIGIEKSSTDTDTFYIEKVAVLPEFRHKGLGLELMNFAIHKIKECAGKAVSVALIDSNTKLKAWYSKQGFTPTGHKDFEHLPFRVCFMNKII